ncbi:Acetyltransferase [Pseudidiomarina piscicola]|uniref:Acetyltransferase n=1 Tax=Pseudidiomarina piscicola TaxID=2614830 RepID=A0A776AJA1_9GAMM|nr:GNAT family N-acetyltransferase [Pseudidiomarina piscicola]CAB0151453.1 Acetyltransferase [Pseudidiomarina piscicola]VZT40932.1 Acetyltransferase [Pseudomonas aeruginosa]
MTLKLNWVAKSFAELTTIDLYRILQLRQDVFIVEQNCPYADADGQDHHAVHLYATDNNGAIVAYARLFGATAQCSYSRIGRVISAGHIRRQGLGRELMRRAIAWCQQHHPDAPIRLGAQVYLRAFYRSFEFREISDDYLEDGIPHVDMERQP